MRSKRKAAAAFAKVDGELKEGLESKKSAKCCQHDVIYFSSCPNRCHPAGTLNSPARRTHRHSSC
jgi:hypothetical protein